MRPSRGSLAIAVILLALGLAVVTQVRSTQEEGLAGLRQADLIQLLDDVSTRADNLEREITELERTRADLTEGDGGAAALASAQQRLEAYQVLAGTVPVEGPGIRLRVSDPGRGLSAEDLMALVQELRDAGAESIQIGSVRIVASSWFGTTPDGALTVSGTVVTAPYEVRAIGDSHTLSGAMAIPGGFNDVVRRSGGTVDVTPDDQVLIDALHHPSEPRYAQPVPAEDD